MPPSLTRCQVPPDALVGPAKPFLRVRPGASYAALVKLSSPRPILPIYLACDWPAFTHQIQSITIINSSYRSRITSTMLAGSRQCMAVPNMRLTT